MNHDSLGFCYLTSNLKFSYLFFCLLFYEGMVKKATGSLGVIHDRSKIIDNSLEECRAAISHTKEFKASINVANILNPDRVLSLFKKMLDEVKLYLVVIF